MGMMGDDTLNPAFLRRIKCNSDLRKIIQNLQDACTVFILEEYIISKYMAFIKKKKDLQNNPFVKANENPYK